MIGGEDYTWTMVSNKLIIEILKPEFYTPDLLPFVLKDIISLLSIPFAEQIKHIEIGQVPAVMIWKQEE